jgi:hypothetical protein
MSLKKIKNTTQVQLYFLLMILLMVMSCGGGGGSSADAASPDTSISGTVSGEVKSGITITLTSGSTTSATTTNANGKFSFTGQAKGTYTVTPSITSYNAFSPASSIATVGGAGVASINFTSIITLADMKPDKSSNLLERQTKQLEVTISPTETNKSITWTSSDMSIVSVSSTGLATAIAVGKATVTGTTSDGTIVSTYSVAVVSPDRLIVIIKADDLAASVGSSFTRLLEVCKLLDIPFSAGLVMKSLETATEHEIEFLSNIDPQECELWIHGYTHSIENGNTEFKGPDKEAQIATLSKCINAAQQYLKRDLSVIGTPGNAADSNTSLALDNFPTIKTVFFQPVGGNRLVLPRLLNVESSTGIMFNHDYIINNSKKLPPGSIAVPQIHPNSWGETQWSEFVLTIDALKNNGAIFMTPSEYTKWINSKPLPD